MSNADYMHPNSREVYRESEDGSKLYREATTVIVRHQGAERVLDEANRQDHDYGVDRFVFIDGKRYRTGSTRTLLPELGDTNFRFRISVALVARRMRPCALQGVQASREFERRDRAYVRATLDINHNPLLDPTPADATLCEQATQRLVDTCLAYGDSIVTVELQKVDGVYVEARYQVVSTPVEVNVRDRIDGDHLKATRQRLERRHATNVA